MGAVHLGLDNLSMAEDQATDADIEAYWSGPTGLQLEEVVFGDAQTTLVCDVSTEQPRPMVPMNWQRRILNALSRKGVKAFTRLVGARFVWQCLNVRIWAGTCVACQRAKIQRHVKAPLVPFLVPER